MPDLLYTTGSPTANQDDVKDRRDATAPDGQILPDWMTWVEYTTTADGMELKTWSIIQLPQTYYGPSIPLGNDWTYGGLSTTASGGLDTLATSASAKDGLSTSESRSREERPSRDGARPSRTHTRPSRSEHHTVSRTQHLSPSSDKFTSSAVTALARSSRATAESHSSSSAGLASSSSLSSSSIAALTHPTIASSSISQRAPTIGASRDLLVILLPALLVPLSLLFIALLLFWLWLWRKRQRSEPKPSHRPTGPAWIPASLRRWNTDHAYIPASDKPEGETQEPGPAVPEKDTPHFLAPPPPSVTPTPTERSALLSEYVPQHHRQSSLPLPRPTGPPEEMDDELAHLVSQNQTLLQRLTAGLAAISRSGSLRSGASGRKPSGNTVERRGSGRYALLQEGSGKSGAQAKKFGSKRESGSHSAGTGNASGSGQGDTSGTTSGPNGATMNDSQLFFRVPAASVSSNEAATSRGSNNSRETSSGSAGSSTRNMRSSWYTSRYAQNLPPGAEPPHWFPDTSNLEAPRQHDTIPEDVSVDVPSTEHSGDGDLGEFGRTIQSGDRLRFPSPPARAPITPPRTAHAFDRRDKGYTHAPLSPFGPSPTASGLTEPVSSSDHSKHGSNENQQLQPPRPTSSLSVARPSSTALAVQSDLPPSLSPMTNVFVATPPGSAGSGDKHRSFTGEPLVDMQKLIFENRDRAGVDEFGQSSRSARR